MLMSNAVRSEAFTKLHSVTALNYLIKKAARLAGLRPVWTAHASRCGWATEAFMRGVSFTQLREMGRWKSDSSLRVYLDSVGAMAVQNEPEMLQAQHWAAAFDGAAFEGYWRG